VVYELFCDDLWVCVDECEIMFLLYEWLVMWFCWYFDVGDDDVSCVFFEM